MYSIRLDIYTVQSSTGRYVQCTVYGQEQVDIYIVQLSTGRYVQCTVYGQVYVDIYSIQSMVEYK